MRAVQEALQRDRVGRDQVEVHAHGLGTRMDKDVVPHNGQGRGATQWTQMDAAWCHSFATQHHVHALQLRRRKGPTGRTPHGERGQAAGIS